MDRALAWFSCGSASAVMAKLALEKYGDRCSVVYCDTSKSESPDNARFLSDIENWLGIKVVKIRSKKYSTVEEVFRAERYMSGIAGAKCTVELKKKPRFDFQKPGDIHLFGLTCDELDRIDELSGNNPDLNLDWILRDNLINKNKCHDVIAAAGIAQPLRYRQGYTNNNCIGCVKATSPAYWNKTRVDDPDVFRRRCEQSRELGVKLVKVNGKRIFLDELQPSLQLSIPLENITCGPECG